MAKYFKIKFNPIVSLFSFLRRRGIGRVSAISYWIFFNDLKFWGDGKKRDETHVDDPVLGVVGVGAADVEPRSVSHGLDDAHVIATIVELATRNFQIKK